MHLHIANHETLGVVGAQLRMPISSELRFGMCSSATLAPTPPSQAPESHSSHLLPGVVDELELHVIPVFFGQGRRLFDGLASEHIELERTRILEGEGGVTHMHYRVRR
jgi:hypothetical protein